MTAFLLQTILLLSIAYFMGAALACFLRRLFTVDAASVVPRPVVRADARPAPATVTVQPASGVTAAAAAEAHREPLRRVDPLPEFSQRPSGVSRFTRALTGTTPSEPRPAPVPITPPVAVPKIVPPPVAAAIAGGVATAAAATVTSVLAKPPTPPAAPVTQAPPVTPAPAPADNLRRIKGIDAGIEAALHKLGVRRYAQIAAWMRPEVANVSQALGFKGRIEQQNWIEQAAILAQGNKTHYVRWLERNNMPMGQPSANAGTPAPVRPSAGLAAAVASVAGGAAGAISAAASAARPAPASLTRSPDVENRAAFATERPSAPVATAPPKPASNPSLSAAAAAIASSAAAADSKRGSHDNFQRISGVTAELEKTLLTNGVTRYDQLAAWSRVDVDSFDKLTSGDGRVLRENWIEQARILSSGGETAYAREYDRRAREAARDVGLARPTRLGDAIKEQQHGRPPEATVTVTPSAPPPSRTVADLSGAPLRQIRSPHASGRRRAAALWNAAARREVCRAG